MLSEEIDVHEAGEHLRAPQCIAGRAGDLPLLPSTSLEPREKDEEYLERNKNKAKRTRSVFRR